MKGVAKHKKGGAFQRKGTLMQLRAVMANVIVLLVAAAASPVSVHFFRAFGAECG